MLKEKYLQPEYLPSKIIIQNWKREKCFSDKQKLKQFINTKLTLK